MVDMFETGYDKYADLFTKPLPRPTFEKWTLLINMKPLHENQLQNQNFKPNESDTSVMGGVRDMTNAVCHKWHW